MINLFLNFYINIQVAGQIVMVNITNLITHCECYTNRGEHRLNTNPRRQQDTDILMAGVAYFMFCQMLRKKLQHNTIYCHPDFCSIYLSEYQKKKLLSLSVLRNELVCTVFSVGANIWHIFFHYLLLSEFLTTGSLFSLHLI